MRPSIWRVEVGHLPCDPLGLAGGPEVAPGVGAGRDGVLLGCRDGIGRVVGGPVGAVAPRAPLRRWGLPPRARRSSVGHLLLEAGVVGPNGSGRATGR